MNADASSPRRKKPVALIIRDGWGWSATGKVGAAAEGNAPLLARVPFQDWMAAECPRCFLSASGLDVGLPAGQMGNSEVGHLNLGAGRIVYQDLTRIDRAIETGEFARNKTLLEFLSQLQARGAALQLLGLLSQGGVHSHENHLYEILHVAKAAAERGAGPERVYIHAFTDGRDSAPTSGLASIRRLQEKIREIGIGTIATAIGRYYAMDRDRRWDRAQQAYELIVAGKGELAADPAAALERCYAAGKTDEFLPAQVFIEAPRPLVKSGDGVLFWNFRADRARQLCRALIEDDNTFDGFARGERPRDLQLVTLTEYDARFAALGVKELFGQQRLDDILGAVVAKAGLKQLRMAETEKYAHVTYFFNGGVETPFPKEDRELVPSPKVATYDLQPQMSAPELTAAVLRRLEAEPYDLLILNYANPDMVGHTGILPAAIAAVEAVDAGVRQVVEKIVALGGAALVTADHGNCERMIQPDGSPCTTHTTNLVECFYVGADRAERKLRDGILADVAPTLLQLLGLPQPAAMTGKSLLTG